VLGSGSCARPASPSSARKIAAILDADLARQPGHRGSDPRDEVILPGPIDATSTTSTSTPPWIRGDAHKGAALGGITTVIPYIQVPASMALRRRLAYFRDEGERESVTDLLCTPSQPVPSKKSSSRSPDAFALGVPSFKLFMAYR